MTSQAAANARHETMPGLSRVAWRKSSRSSYTNGCVEVGSLSIGVVGVRDTKSGGDGPVLIYTEADWSAFLASIKNGQAGLAL